MLTFYAFLAIIIARNKDITFYFLAEFLQKLGDAMYKTSDKSQPSLFDFNQPLGLSMSPDNRWVQLAARVPWEVFEEKYAALFPSGTGNVAKPLRLALGSLIIQNRFQYSDRELVEQLAENPYLQYFIGLPGYQDVAPFDPSTLVWFRKRITIEILNEANEYMLEHNDDGRPMPPVSGSTDGDAPQEEPANEGTLIIDASCAPVNIRYPQDISLLNEAREKLEHIIYRMCKSYGLPLPRCYLRNARKDYLAFVKCRKHTEKKVREAIKKQLSYVRRDIGCLEGFFSRGYAPGKKDIPLYLVIIRLYQQQEYMYKNHVHSVTDRIVSIDQPWIRPIVRGKAKTPVEFEPKLDVSIDGEGYGRIEKVSFDPYNESGNLIGAVERYRERTGQYPERVLADKIYRTKENRAYCRKQGIRLSGPKLGRPSKNAEFDKKQEHQDNTDRIEVERFFSRSKRCFGMGRIVTKLETTQLTSVALSVFVSNLFRIQRRILVVIFDICYKGLVCVV